MDKRGLIEEIFKLVSELRANGLKSKLSPEPAMDEVEMPGHPGESASGEQSGMPSQDEETPGPDALKKLLELMGGE